MRNHVSTWAVLMVAGLMVSAVIFRPREPRASEAPKVADDGIDRLTGQLKAHPAPPSQGNEKLRLYLLDVDRGTATLIADEPASGLTHCGSARWSRDGKRILFDATPGSEWNKTHIFAIDLGEARPKLTDLGAGNAPSPSPDGKRIAFLLNSGAVPGAESGLWIMNPDGSGRRHLGSFGRPSWSPDNRQVLIVGFSDPCQLTLLDVPTEKSRPLLVPGHEVRSIPSWADETTIVAALGTADGLAIAIALLDVTDPGQCKVKEVLREKDARPAVTPAYPVYSAEAGRCVFVNANPKGMSLYCFEPGKNPRPRRVERDGFDRHITDLALSPDGRYLVFCSDRAVPKSP